jgi:hypothetical protein
VSKHVVRFGRRSTFDQIRPTRIDFRDALSSRRTWIEAALGVLAVITLVLIVRTDALWPLAALAVAGAIGDGARVAARRRLRAELEVRPATLPMKCAGDTSDSADERAIRRTLNKCNIGTGE